MGKRITLLFTDDEWNFLYNLQTIAFIASYRNPSATPISDILKAMINDRYFVNHIETPDSELLKKIRQEMKNDVDEEISRLGNMGYSKGNYVLNLSDYDLESLKIHIEKRKSNEKNKITESKMVKILVRENMQSLSNSLNVAGNIYISVLFGIGADGYVLLNNVYESVMEEVEKKPDSLEILIPSGEWFLETARRIQKDLPIVMDFFKLMKENGFPRDFNKYMEERKKYWSIVSYFNYMTAAAGLITSLRILIYPTSWIPDFIFGSFSDRFPGLRDLAIGGFLIGMCNLMRRVVIEGYLNNNKDAIKNDQEVDELYKIAAEYVKKSNYQ